MSQAVIEKISLPIDFCKSRRDSFEIANQFRMIPPCCVERHACDVLLAKLIYSAPSEQIVMKNIAPNRLWNELEWSSLLRTGRVVLALMSTRAGD